AWSSIAVHSHLQPRTNYNYRVQVMSRNGSLTPMSAIGTIMTVPAQPAVKSSVFNNDMALLDWTFTPAGADEVNIYVSATGNANSYHPYYDTVLPTQPGVHYIEETGDSQSLPGDVTEARHDTVGVAPARVSTLSGSGTDTGGITFSWLPVANPPANAAFWYYIAGVSAVGEEG